MDNLLNVSKNRNSKRVYVVRFVNRPISGITEIALSYKYKLHKCYRNIMNEKPITIPGSSIAQFLVAASLFCYHRNTDLKQMLQILWMKTIVPCQIWQFPYFGWHHCNTIIGKAPNCQNTEQNINKKIQLTSPDSQKAKVLLEASSDCCF